MGKSIKVTATNPCAICGSEFLVEKRWKDTQKCCSSKCNGVLCSINRTNLVVLTCLHCKKEFERSKARVDIGEYKFCSNACVGKYLKKDRADRICEFCGESFQTTQHLVNIGKGLFCSKKCSLVSRKNGKMVNCQHCNKEFYLVPSKHDKYCSVTCGALGRIGKYTREKNGKWKGELRKNKGSRASHELRDWRKAVYERDNYRCTKCDKIGERLNAHHLIPWRESIDLRFEIENGITLCVPCHLKIHEEDRKNRWKK